MSNSLSLLGDPLAFIRQFLQQESSSGLLLMLSAALALAVANSPWAAAYFAAQHWQLGPLRLLHWINDGLMALFFLMVGLEIKREVLEGQLSDRTQRVLPGVAALGGMLVPALIYLACTRGNAEVLRGWAIPTATDIAFALGVLSLLGPRVPVSLKIFLTALAIIDDLGAVLVIALFYTQSLALPALAGAAAVLAMLALLNRRHVSALWPYLLLGALLWLLVLQSGLHATLAGVALAMTVPLRTSKANAGLPLHRLEHGLHPWVAYAIIPLFGFANAGVSLLGISPAMLLAPVPLGIALGLSVGKLLGVFGSALLAIRFGFAKLPEGSTWTQLFALALLCGVGFTMSLFIGALAFAEAPALLDATRIGVLLGSLVSALAGSLLMRAALPSTAP